MAGYIGTKAALLSTTTASVGGDSTVGGDLTVDTDTLYVDSTNNRVGIGASSPSYAIHTKSSSGGVGLIESTASNSDLYFKDSGTSYSYSNGIGSIGNALRFRSGDGTERMRIDGSGRVTTPYQPAVTAVPTNSGSNTAGSGDATHLVFGNVLFNNGNHYSTSTGIFTCPVAGYYFVSANIRWETADFAQTSYIRTFISKNDGNYNSTRIHVISGNNEALSSYMDQTVSGVVYCSANDTLRLKGGENSATDAVYHGESSFSVYLLG